MSARREHRLRKLEARVAYLEDMVHYMEKREMVTEEQGKRIKALEKLAASPIVTIGTGERPAKAPSILERLRKRVELWKFRRKYLGPGVSREEAEKAFESWKASPSIEYMRDHPPGSPTKPSTEEPKKRLQKFEAVFSHSNLCQAYKMTRREKRWKNKSQYR